MRKVCPNCGLGFRDCRCPSYARQTQPQAAASPSEEVRLRERIAELEKDIAFEKAYRNQLRADYDHMADQRNETVGMVRRLFDATKTKSLEQDDDMGRVADEVDDFLHGYGAAPSQDIPEGERKEPEA